MKKQDNESANSPQKEQNNSQAKTKKNTYTQQENQFADGEGTKLDKAIDGDEINPATRGE